MSTTTHQVSTGGTRTLTKKEAEDLEKAEAEKMAAIHKARAKLVAERNKKLKTPTEVTENAS